MKLNYIYNNLMAITQVDIIMIKKAIRTICNGYASPITFCFSTTILYNLVICI